MIQKKKLSRLCRELTLAFTYIDEMVHLVFSWLAGFTDVCIYTKQKSLQASPLTGQIEFLLCPLLLAFAFRELIKIGVANFCVKGL